MKVSNTFASDSVDPLGKSSMEMLHEEEALNGSKELSGGNLQNQQRDDHSALAESGKSRLGLGTWSLRYGLVRDSQLST